MTKQRRAAVELSLRGFTDDQIAVALIVSVDRVIALIYGRDGADEQCRPCPAHGRTEGDHRG
jgi:orotate phosphoribosyltransferase-like protein